MATPKTITDASSDLDEAVLNLFVRGGKLQVKMNYAVLLFTAATNAVTVSATGDSDGEIVSGDCTWSAGSLRIEVTLTGFSVAPMVMATIAGNSSTNVEKVWSLAGSSSVAYIYFKSNATPGVNVDPDANVEVNLLVIGA